MTDATHQQHIDPPGVGCYVAEQQQECIPLKMGSSITQTVLLLVRSCYTGHTKSTNAHGSDKLLESTSVAQAATLHASHHRAWPYPAGSTITWSIVCEVVNVGLRVYNRLSLQADARRKSALIDICRRGNTGIELIK